MHSQRQGRLMACLHFSLIGLMFSSHILRKDIVRQPPSSASPCTPFPTCLCEMGGCGPRQPVPGRAACSAPIPLHGTQLPNFPLLHVAEAHRAGEQVPTHPTAPSPGQDWVEMGRGVPILSFEGPSLTPSLTFPCTFAVAQQPDFTEILRSEACFSQNDPQASHSSIHQYCSLQGSALVSFLALNKLAEIPELVRTAWCCP